MNIGGIRHKSVAVGAIQKEAIVLPLKSLEKSLFARTQTLLGVEQFKAPHHRRSSSQQFLASGQEQLLSTLHIDLDVNEALGPGEAIEPPRLHAGVQLVAGLSGGGAREIEAVESPSLVFRLTRPSASARATSWTVRPCGPSKPLSARLLRSLGILPGRHSKACTWVAPAWHAISRL